MDLETLQKKHDHFVSRVAAMLIAQGEYFDAKRRHYDGQPQLAKAKSLEAEVKKLVKEEYAERKTRATVKTLF